MVAVADSGITATISNAQDQNADVAPSATSNSFSIDTLAPTGTPVATAVVNVASSTLTVVTTFSKAMNTSVAPSITFTPDISADLTAGAASWTDATHYSAAYAATSSVDVSAVATVDRKSTRLNYSHANISYAA